MASHEQLKIVVSTLEQEIALGRLLPRERLIEEDLARRFQVGRHVVRQAISDLQAKGLVTRPPNRGAAVKDISPDEVEQIYAVRCLLERYAAELIPLPLKGDLHDRLVAIDGQHRQAITDRNLAEVYRHNLEFHRVFFSACSNATLVECIEQFALKSHSVRSHSIADQRLLQRAADEHGLMLQALSDGDRPTLVRLVEAHVQPAKQAYIDLYRRRVCPDPR